MFGLVPFYSRREGMRPLFSNIENMIERMFNDDLFWVPVFTQSFKADIKETDKEYIVEAELPGLEKENINITFEDDVLSISVKRDEVIDEKKENFIRKERRSGNIERRFQFAGVDVEKISARYKDGILTVVLPKKETDLNRSRQISIN